MTGLIDRVGHVAERLLHPTTHDVLDAAMDQRMVIVDVETTGLDVRRDDLLAIGAVSIQAGRLQLGDAFSVLMDADTTPSPHNMLVHRLTPRLLRGGAPPREALDAFLDFAGHAPLLAVPLHAHHRDGELDTGEDKAGGKNRNLWSYWLREIEFDQIQLDFEKNRF